MFRPYLSEMDFQSRILEIGPLDLPNVTKEQYEQVYYADIRSTEDLKAFYTAYEKKDNIVNVDYVINEHGYADTLRNVEKFDYIVATHVIEHVPQLIFWFQDLSNILKPNGRLCLSIPDKRYTFDHYRYQTTFAECFEVYTKNIKNLPARVLDEYINATKSDPVYWWERFDDMDAIPKGPAVFRNAVDLYQKALADNNYTTPGHYSIFTPESFLFILYGMHKLSLLPFRCVEFYDTEENSNEFNCVLLNCPELLDSDAGMMEAEDDNLRTLLKRHQDYYSSPHYVRDKIFVFLDISSEDIAAIAGMMTKDVSFSQTVKLDAISHLMSVKLFIGTYMRENTSKIQFDIIDMAAHHIVFSTVVDTAGIRDNAFHKIDLPLVEVKKGAMYEFRFTSIDGTSGNAVTIYTTGKGKTTDAMYGMINGERQDFNFSMKISGIK